MSGVKTNRGSRSTAAAVLTLFGATLCALAVGGFLIYRFYVLRPYLFHPVMFGVSGALALAVACTVGFRRPLLKWLGIAAAIAGASEFENR